MNIVPLEWNGNLITPAISLAQAYAKASESFKKDGIYFHGLDSKLESSVNGKVIYSVYPRDKPLLKLYFIF